MWGANRVGSWLFWGDDWDGPREGRYENGVLRWRSEEEKSVLAPPRKESAVPKQAPAASKSEATDAYHAALTAVENAKKALDDSRSVLHKADFAAMSADLASQQESCSELKQLVEDGAFSQVLDRSRAIVAKADDIQAQLRSVPGNLEVQPVQH